ncbi:MAG: hypothetical protein C4297_13175 [Gemmataceae bacterium]
MAILTDGGVMGSAWAVLLGFWVAWPAALHSSGGTAQARARPVSAWREQLYLRDQPEAQAQAALWLLLRDDPNAREIVAQGLQDHTRQDVFQALCQAVAATRDERYAPWLWQALFSAHGAVRSSAADALGRLVGESWVGPLGQLAGDPNHAEQTRIAAVTALKRHASKQAVRCLIEISDSAHGNVRAAALSALAEITGLPFEETAHWRQWWASVASLSEADWQKTRADYLQHRVNRLESDVQRLQGYLLQVYQQLYARSAAPERVVLARTLTRSELPAVRLQGLAWLQEVAADPTLSAWQRRVVLETLLELQYDSNPQVLRELLLALATFPDPASFVAIAHKARVPQAPVRAAALRALGRHPLTLESEDCRRQAIEQVRQALNDTSPAVVAEAIESLAQLERVGQPGSSDFVPLRWALPFFRHISPEVRRAASRVVEKYPHPDMLATLFDAWDDEDSSVRFNAVGAVVRLGQLGLLTDAQKETALKRLEIVLVRDPDAGVRSRAAAAFEDLGTVAHLALLWSQWRGPEDPRVQVRCWAAIKAILARAGQVQLVLHYAQELARLPDSQRRIELLDEVYKKWSKQEVLATNLDPLAVTLVEAQLESKQGPAVLSLARKLLARSKSEEEIRQRLRLLVAAARQAAEQNRLQEALEALQDTDPYLVKDREMAVEIEMLRALLRKGKMP